jgi:hypothetical protein
MNDQDKVLTAYCGLYCGDCIRYKSKAADLSLELLNELKRVHFENYAKAKRSSVKELEGYAEMIKTIETISNLKCNTLCRLGGEGCVNPCQIKKCVTSKNLKGCWECNEFEECDKFEFLKPFHGDGPRKNLKKIKKYGLDNWSIHREKFYSWL